MEYTKLENNIMDVLKEEQVKLGYRSEAVRLYYPLHSLNRFLQTNYGIEEMQAELELFSQSAEHKLGRIAVSHERERFCFLLPPQASDFVHDHMHDTDFICTLVNTVSKHGTTIADVLELFHKFSDNVHAEKVSHGEFDYLVYFEDGEPDAFRYCITDEGCHISYHRFTEEDYNDFHFETQE